MTIRIHVRLAEPFWRVVGERELEIRLPAGSTVDSLINQLIELYPDLDEEFRQAPPLVFIGDSEVDQETHLEEGANVHLVWPIAGG